MAYWHAHRAQDHSDGFTYIDPDTGERKKLTPNERVLLLTICLALPSKYKGRREPCEGQRHDLTQKQLSKLSGIPEEGVANASRTLSVAELIDYWQPSQNRPNIYQLHNRLYCSAFGCLNARHYPDGWPGVVETTPPGEEELQPGGRRFSGARGVKTPELIRTKEVNNLITGKPGGSVFEQAPGKPLSISSESDLEDQAKLTRARERVNQELENRGRHLPPNLYQWCVILWARDKDRIDQALEWAGQGYDLKPDGKWRGGRVDVFDELTRIGEGD